MAFLMLLHEKMRLQRKQNKLTLKQLHNGSQLSRMESRIKKREKYYAKLKKQIETQGNLYKNQAQMMINNQFGMGTNSWNPNQLFMGGGVGLNQTQVGLIQEAAKGITIAGFDSAKLIQLMMNNPMAFKSKENTTEGSDGKKTTTYEYRIEGYNTALSNEDYRKIYDAAQAIKTQQSMMGQMATQWKNEYDNNISIWIQAQTEAIEMQEEYEMDMLGEEQADFEAEKESIAAELELVKQRKEAIEQELGSSIKDAAPKFGLA